MARKAIVIVAAFLATAATFTSQVATNLNLTALLHCTTSILLSTGTDAAKVADSFRTSISEYLFWLYRRLSGFSPDQAYLIWRQVRAQVVAPVLRIAIMLCIAMSVMLASEVLFTSVVSLGVKLLGWKPERRYKWEPIKEDAELGSLAYPMVLVQIPMYNEFEVYKLSIGAACALTWAPDRIIIQVLDDSSDPLIQELVELECKVWASKGINIIYEHREDRKGFKAGALKKGMECNYVYQCDFVAIFDADFQPESDFLMRTIPFLVHNPELALVQTRWDFVNYKKCLVTRVQKISLDYHFKAEQESGSSAYDFFGFNGTAGVWRISAINEAGGWKDRTTVEDMDLSVRATLKGWKFLYVGDIKVKSELPSTFEAYCKQQHRWTSGGTSLFRKMASEIIGAKEISIWKKLYLIYSFFFIRRIVAPVVAFAFYCILMPVSVIVPEVSIPIWGAFYIPTALLLLNVIHNHSSVHIYPLWILFENAMSLHRLKACFMGLLDIGNVNEWVVTKKLGETDLKQKTEVAVFKSSSTKSRNRVSFSQLGLAVFLLCCASYNVVFGTSNKYIYIYLQAFAIGSMGFGCFGACVSNC